MAKKSLTPHAWLYPLPVVLVTCVAEDGSPNVLTVAWAGVVCSEPPQIGISIRHIRYSHGLIKGSREFVVNVPSEEMLEQTDICGCVSGRNADKFALTGLTPVPATKVRPPLIDECPLNLECRVVREVDLGSHELFVGEIVAIHVDESLLDPHGGIDYSKARPFAYCSPDYWSLARKIGSYGFTRGKRQRAS